MSTNGGTRLVICHNCAGFGHTVGPVMVAICGDEASIETTSARRPDRTIDTIAHEMLVYECPACSGAGYLSV
jgi:hypothetical protein